MEPTQRARTLGLEGRFEEAHALLDTLPADDPRVAIERGRLFRTAGDDARAEPFFSAAARAEDPDLRVDALHILALVAPLGSGSRRTRTRWRSRAPSRRAGSLRC